MSRRSAINSKIKQDAIAIWKAGVAGADSRKLVREAIEVSNATIRFWQRGPGSADGVFLQTSNRNLESVELETGVLGRLIVIGFGKCSGGMAIGLEQAFGDRLSEFELESHIIVPDDQLVETKHLNVVGCRPAGINLPTERVVKATQKIVELAESAAPNDLVVCLISGGGSALFEWPIDSITLDELCEATSQISRAGASIYQLNAVRRALSQVKGGRLASRCAAPLVSLIISDVIGNDLDVIASGPTVSPSNRIDPLEVLNTLEGKKTKFAQSIWNAVKQRPPVIQPKDLPLATNLVIGDGTEAAIAASHKAAELGFGKFAFSVFDDKDGDAESSGARVVTHFAKVAEEEFCLIENGETTVDVCEDPGRGGRNQHFVLAALLALLENGSLPNEPLEYCLVSGGTDGEDGTVAVPGGVFDHMDVRSLRKEKDLRQFRMHLDRCDSYPALQEHRLLLEPFKTWTNVCDLRVLLISRQGDESNA